ncbi:hypothetical protein CH282_15280 [Rhodococcus sp. 06-418-1B]|nr:helix-turn-helix domain-containing protein [Rhodococcus sp. 06-418-1B]OZC84497.1 hypothetical protein CH282_15280 [Rhodococcus sp. 06-418-1B]
MNLVTVAEAAQRLGTTDQFVRKQIRTGQLPAISINARALRIRPEDLDAWIDSRSKQVPA